MNRTNFQTTNTLSRITLTIGALLALAVNGLGQSSLSLSATQTNTAGIASKDIVFSRPANASVGGMQWTLFYPATQISGVSVTPSAALTAMGKTLTCVDTGGSYTCIAAGPGANSIPNGVIGTLHATPNGTSQSTSIGVSNAMLVANDGTGASVAASGAALNLPSLTLTGLTCNSSMLMSGGTIQCSVNFNFPIPAGGLTLQVSSSSAQLNIPSTIAVPAGATSQSFSISAGTIGANGVATITTTAAGSSKTVTLALNSVAAISGLQCTPAVLMPGTQSQCTVTLTKAAASSGVTVALASSSSALTVPASVAVAAGATTASFKASAGTYTSAQTVSVSATTAGMTKVTPVSLAMLNISSVSCVAAYLSANRSTQCTVTMTAPVSGASTITLASGASVITVPPSVTISAGSNSAVFTAQVGTFSTSQVVAIRAAYGVSVATTNISISSYPNVSSISCTSQTVSPNSSGTCTVALSAPAANSTVRFTSTAGLTFPATISVPTGAMSANVNFTVGALPTQPLLLTATLGASMVNYPFTLAAPTQNITINCAPHSSAGHGCHIGISQPAPAGGMTLTVQSSSKRVQVPASVHIEANATGADFTAAHITSPDDETVSLHATAANATPASTSVLVQGVRPASMSCSPRVVAPGKNAVCVVQLNASDVPDAMVLEVSASGSQMNVPATLATRGGQRAIRFEARAAESAADGDVTVTAHYGSHTVEQSISIVADQPLRMTAPDSISGTPNSVIEFAVTATNSQNLPAVVLASDLPRGAAFDMATSTFRWIASQDMTGEHAAVFTARDGAGHEISKKVTMHIDSGKPVIESLRNAASEAVTTACSAGSVTAIQGRFLVAANNAVEDRSGQSNQLGGTKVLVNGAPAAVVAVSAERAEFVCPQVAAGTPLDLAVENGEGQSNHLQLNAADAEPGIFTVDRAHNGQALAVRTGSSDLAALPNDRFNAMPLFSGDQLTVYTTGVACNDAAGVRLKVGDAIATITSLKAAAKSAGVCEVTAEVPGVAGDKLPLSLEVTRADGTLATSNHPSVTVEER